MTCPGRRGVGTAQRRHRPRWRGTQVLLQRINDILSHEEAHFGSPWVSPYHMGSMSGRISPMHVEVVGQLGGPRNELRKANERRDQLRKIDRSGRRKHWVVYVAFDCDQHHHFMSACTEVKDRAQILKRYDVYAVRHNRGLHNQAQGAIAEGG